MMVDFVNNLRTAADVFESYDMYDKAHVCRDIAAKLIRFGDFASVKQRRYAESLIARAQELSPGGSANNKRSPAPEGSVTLKLTLSDFKLLRSFVHPDRHPNNFEAANRACEILNRAITNGQT